MAGLPTPMNSSLAHRRPRFGPLGELVHSRTYAMEKPDGGREAWWETVVRAVDGNLGLVDQAHIEHDERTELLERLFSFDILPGGRHLAMAGKPGRQFLSNCHAAGWQGDITTHFTFTFDQLMQGGGVGANYSDRFLSAYPPVSARPRLRIVCDATHPDYSDMRPLLSDIAAAECLRPFVIPDSREGWTTVLKRLIQAFWAPEDADVTVDMTSLRGCGEKIRSFGGTASGPVYLAHLLHQVHSVLSRRFGDRVRWEEAMEIDHAIAACVISGNIRRGARMSVKHWADGSIFDFIKLKERDGHHWSTNISVSVDDEFFEALSDHNEHAAAVLESAVEGMLTNGEPGFFNESLASQGERQRVYVTNPCGEIAFEEWENCTLGHVNLDAHCDGSSGLFDLERCLESFRLMTRFLIRSTFGDVTSPLQRAVMDRNRRIGVGFTGFHGWLVKQGIQWSRSATSEPVRDALRMFRSSVRAESRRYAAELGIPAPVKATCVAPAGTVSKLPGVSEGMEPIKFRYFEQRLRFSSEPEDPNVAKLRKQGFAIEVSVFEPNTLVVVLPCKHRLLEEVERIYGEERSRALLEEAHDISLVDMLAVQRLVQEEYADNAVAFTASRWANAVQQQWIAKHPTWSENGLSLPPPAPEAVREVMAAIRRFLPHLKGTTIMVDGSRQQAPYTELTWPGTTEPPAEQGVLRFLGVRF